MGQPRFIRSVPQVIQRCPPRDPAGIIAEYIGLAAPRPEGIQMKYERGQRRIRIQLIKISEQTVCRIPDLFPAGIPCYLCKQPRICRNLIRGHRIIPGEPLRIFQLRPGNQILGLVYRISHQIANQCLSFLQIADLSLTSPLPVRRQKGKGNVKIPVRRHIFAQILSRPIRLPSHQAAFRQAMIFIVTENAVEFLMGMILGIRHIYG